MISTDQKLGEEATIAKEYPIGVIERFGDPLLPDSVDMGTWTTHWYHDMLNIARPNAGCS